MVGPQYFRRILCVQSNPAYIRRILRGRADPLWEDSRNYATVSRKNGLPRGNDEHRTPTVTARTNVEKTPGRLADVLEEDAIQKRTPSLRAWKVCTICRIARQTLDGAKITRRLNNGRTANRRRISHWIPPSITRKTRIASKRNSDWRNLRLEEIRLGGDSPPARVSAKVGVAGLTCRNAIRIRNHMSGRKKRNLPAYYRTKEMATRQLRLWN